VNEKKKDVERSFPIFYINLNAALPLQEDKGTPFGFQPGAGASCCAWIEIALPAWDMQTETGRAHEKKGKASKKTAPGRTGTAACFALFGASLVQGIISPHTCCS